MVNLNKVVALPSPRWKTKLAQSRQHVDINRSGLLLMTTSSLRLIEKYRLHYPVTAIRIYSTQNFRWQNSTRTWLHHNNWELRWQWSTFVKQPLISARKIWQHVNKAQIGPSWPNEHEDETPSLLNENLVSLQVWALFAVLTENRHKEDFYMFFNVFFQYWGHSSQATSKCRRVLVATECVPFVGELWTVPRQQFVTDLEKSLQKSASNL